MLTMYSHKMKMWAKTYLIQHQHQDLESHQFEMMTRKPRVNLVVSTVEIHKIIPISAISKYHECTVIVIVYICQQRHPCDLIIDQLPWGELICARFTSKHTCEDQALFICKEWEKCFHSFFSHCTIQMFCILLHLFWFQKTQVYAVGFKMLMKLAAWEFCSTSMDLFKNDTFLLQNNIHV